ncbi:MAG: hypothetical protein M1821_001982 [Bathelium mastoideum]|nr:MAG: hypothetical protein M1821_001982 [Bathelium mastoideum]
MLQKVVVLLAVVAAKCCAKVVFPRQTIAPSNATITSTPASSSGLQNATNPATTPSPTCCAVAGDGVALNLWWTSSLEVTVATVITNYIQYNNTVLPGNMTTIYNHNATSDLYGFYSIYSLSGVPTTLDLGGNIYGGTSILKATELVIDSTLTITSPTPFMGFDYAGIWTGPPFQPTPGGSYVCYTESTEIESGLTTDHGTTTIEPYATLIQPNNPLITVSGDAEMAPLTFPLNPEYAYLDVNISGWQGDDFGAIPQGFIKWLESVPSVTSKWPYLTNCFPAGFEGEPTVHIPVNELTNTLSSTITVAGNAPGTGPSPAPQPGPHSGQPTSAPMPSPSNQPSPVPVPAPVPQPVDSPSPANSPVPAQSPTPANSPVPANSPGPADSAIPANPSEPAKSPAPANPPQPVDSPAPANSPVSSGIGGEISSILSSGSGSSAGSGGSRGSSSEQGSGSGGSRSSGKGSSSSGSESSGSGGSSGSSSSSPGSGSSSGGSDQPGLSGSKGSSGSRESSGSRPDSGSGGSGSGSGSGSEGGNFGAGPESPSSTGSSSSSSGTREGSQGSSGPPESASGPPSGGGSAEGGAQGSNANGAMPGATVNLPAGSSSTIPAVVGPSGGIILPNSKTIAPGEATTYGGVPISVPTAQGGASPSAVVIGSGSGASIIPIAGSKLGSSPQSVNIGGESVPISYASAGSGIVLPNGETVKAGSVATYKGQTVSLAPSGSAIVVGGSTMSLSGPAPTDAGSSGTVNIGGQAISYSKALSGSGIILGNGETIPPGAAAQTINGVPVSLASGGSALAVGSSFVALSPSPTQQTVNVGGFGVPISYAPDSRGIILPNGQTLAPGSSTVINGISVSLSPSETGLQVGISSIALSGPSQTRPGTYGSITIGSQVVPVSFATNGAGIVLPNGETLSAGQATTINGVPISLAPEENFIVDGSSTIPLTVPAEEQSITLGSKTVPISYASDGQGIILPNGQTLHPGEVTTISGTTISLVPGETAVVVNGKTETLHPGAFTTGVGSYIASGLGVNGPSATEGSYIIPGGAPGSTAQASGSGAGSLLQRDWSASALAVVASICILWWW